MVITTFAEGNSMLNSFIKENRLDLIHKLYDDGFPLSSKTTGSVKFAIMCGHDKIAYYLIEKHKYTETCGPEPISITYSDNMLNLEEIFKCAILHNKYGMVLELGDVNIHYENDIGICIAAENGFYDIVRLLISLGANIHTNLEYPLRWAVMKGHTDIVKLLIDKGADISYVDDLVLSWTILDKRSIMEEIIKTERKNKK